MFNKYFFSLLVILLPMLAFGSAEKEFPLLFKGRYRPSEAYARLWLFELYHSETLKSKDLTTFKADSALDLIFKLNVLGHQPWSHAPLFWVGSKEVKNLAGLNLKRSHFSYEELDKNFYQNSKTSQSIFTYLLTSEFLKIYSSPKNKGFFNKFELKILNSTIWLQFQDSQLTVLSMPSDSLWKNNFTGQTFTIDLDQELTRLACYKKNTELLLTVMGTMQLFASLNGIESTVEKKFKEHFNQLKSLNLSSKEIAQTLEKNYPLKQRLSSAGSLLIALPSGYGGSWISLNALNLEIYSSIKDRLVPISNFTLYSNKEFENIRKDFNELNSHIVNGDRVGQQLALNHLSHSLLNSYQKLSGKTSTEANGKALYYPTLKQLKAEAYYYSYPWIKLLIILYAISAISLCFAYRLTHPMIVRFAVSLLIGSFILHTGLLFWRSYLLNRPPVSNMFETVFYVPWVTVCGALILNIFKKNIFTLIASTLAATILLTLIEFTELNQSLDNVQAVLDSQFWLFIHVLLVVGSYGMFILGAILAHFYLVLYLIDRKETQTMHLLSESVLQSIYLGLVMLIPGTLLGGVWAAESWGRFWDWDPKESWAFISICLYLIWVHAFHYRKIASFGLAIGAISGLLAISFTWYGVNYILGTGLHSYGFGSGGEILYYAYIGVELLFISVMLLFHRKQDNAKM